MASVINVTDITSEEDPTTAKATADALECYAIVAREKAVQLAAEGRDLSGAPRRGEPATVARIRRVEELAILAPQTHSFGA